MNYSDYIKMQKITYEDSSIKSELVVGFYDWHEEFPYETQLLYKYGDLRKPIFEEFKNKVALDFACGPGRMIPRMKEIFKRVDGADISERLLIEAREKNPASNFYNTSGDDLGNAPKNSYDFVYSTIAMQHIAVRDIRLNILKQIKNALKADGKLTIQMAFSKDYPYVKTKEFNFKGNKIEIKKKDFTHADWMEQRTNAVSTNSSCDVYINSKTLSIVKKDFEKYFKNVSFWFYDVSLIYDDLNGTSHYNKYWPSHWIFIHAENYL